MNKDINYTLNAIVPILRMNGEKVKAIEAVENHYTLVGRTFVKEVAEITYDSGVKLYADIGDDSNLTALYDVIAVIQEIKPTSTGISNGNIIHGIYEMP